MMIKILKLFAAVVIIVISYFVIRFINLGKKSREMTPEIGLLHNELRDCGPKPNCVCSFAKDKSKVIEAIKISNSKADLVAKLKIYLQKNAKIISETENYIHAEFSSSLFGFVDDVEFYFPEDSLHMRSASRVGHSDMGQNRKRLNTIIDFLKPHL